MDYLSFQKKVGKQIKQLRTAHELTQEEISGLEMSVRTYQKIENAEHGISLKSIYNLSKKLGIHPREFFHFDVPWAGKK